MNSRLKADEIVNLAIDNKLAREGAWKRKHSSAVSAAASLGQWDLGEGSGGSLEQMANRAKKKSKKEIRKEEDQEMYDHVSSLVQQGEFLKLLQRAEADATWKSFVFGLPSYTMKFLLNACLDTLATKANLYKWGKSTSSKCRLCEARETTNHILNCCQVALEQGRYSYRHDSVLNYIADQINTDLYTAYCDVEGKSCNGRTIPPSILVTELRPDLFVLNAEARIIWILELTCPFETRIDEAHKLKEHKYDHLLGDLEEKGFEVQYIAFEVGSRGQVTKENIARLKNIFSLCHNNLSFKNFKENVSAIAISSSYFIFSARHERQWKRDLVHIGPVFIEPQENAP